MEVTLSKDLLYSSGVSISQNHLPHSLKHVYWHKNRWIGPFLGFDHTCAHSALDIGFSILGIGNYRLG